MKRTIILLCIMLMTISLGAEGQQEEEYVPSYIDKTLDAAREGEVYIDNVSGWIKVDSWDRNAVRVQGEIGKDVKRFDFTSRGDKTFINVVLPRKINNWNRNYDANLEITVPSGSDLIVKTVSAFIEVDDVRGDLETSSVSGKITINSDCEYMSAKTVSGKISITGNTGSIDLETISGKIKVEGTTAELQGSSVSGSLFYTGGITEIVNLKSTSGRIEVTCDPDKKARIDLNSLSGSVELTVPKNVEARFSLKSFSGSLDFLSFIRQIDNLDDDAMVLENGHKEVRFTSGSGDARITVESFSSRVTLETK